MLPLSGRSRSTQSRPAVKMTVAARLRTTRIFAVFHRTPRTGQADPLLARRLPVALTDRRCTTRLRTEAISRRMAPKSSRQAADVEVSAEFPCSGVSGVVDMAANERLRCANEELTDTQRVPRAGRDQPGTLPIDHRRRISNSAIRSESSLRPPSPRGTQTFFRALTTLCQLTSRVSLPTAELRREGCVGQQRGKKRKDL
jgi:hypothetical protein